MRLLLDTHIFLWSISDSKKLKPAVRKLIEAADEVYVSSASIWEISIKARLGKIDTDPQDLLAAVYDSGYIELPVTGAHAVEVAALPLHHADPFDRMLIAQAIHEPLKLLTADAVLKQYSDLVVLV